MLQWARAAARVTAATRTLRIPRAHASTGTPEARGKAPAIKVGAVTGSGVARAGLFLNVEPSAVARLRALEAEYPDDAQTLRIRVDPGGCSGFQIKFDFDDTHDADDLLFRSADATIVVDDVSLALINGSTVKFTEDLMRSVFEVADNPQADDSCGCGISFGTK